MNIWPSLAFLRFLIPFIIGIILQGKQSFIPEEFLFWVLPLTAAMLILVQLITRNKQNIFLGMGILTLFLATGFYTSFLHSSAHKPYVLQNETQNEIFIGEISEEPELGVNSIKAEVNILYSKHRNGNWQALSEKVLVYFRKRGVNDSLHFGDKVSFKGNLKFVKPPLNPYEFDYQSYLAGKGIRFQSFVASNSWKITKKNTETGIRALALNCRSSALQILKKSGLSEDNYAVAAALLLGFDNELTEGILNSYAGSGVLHILSVSGMHVALLFLLLSFLFKPFEKTNKLDAYRNLTILFVIWFYAILAGLSPSVCRSAAMFTILLTGKAIKREGNIYNTLSASAFFLLLYNPSYLYDIGFQLSYAAVGGIILLYQPLNQLFYFQNFFKKHIWSLISVSLAAQVFTTPLSLYYFHQFPVYFLPANLCIVPLSSLVMYVSIGLLAFSPLPFMGYWLGTLSNGLLTLLNSVVGFFAGLPGAVARGIYFDRFEMALLFLVTCAIILFIFYKKPIYLKCTIFILMVMISYPLYIRFNLLRSSEVTIFHLPGNKVVAVRQGDFIEMIGSKKIEEHQNLLEFHVIPQLIQTNTFEKGLKSLQQNKLADKSCVIKLKGQKYLWIVEDKLEITGSKADFILLPPGKTGLINEFYQKKSETCFIIDGRTKEWQFKQLKNKYPGVKIYYTGEKGALQLPI